MDKVLVNIEHYGNTSAATLPLCIWDFEDKLKKGDNIIFTAFGAGFTWGAVYVKWGYDGKKESYRKLLNYNTKNASYFDSMRFFVSTNKIKRNA